MAAEGSWARQPRGRARAQASVMLVDLDLVKHAASAGRDCAAVMGCCQRPAP